MRNALWLSAGLFLLACTPENNLVDGDGNEAPQLTMDTPAPAAWMSRGYVDVSGTAKGLRDVTVNEGPAPIEGDGWAGEVELVRGVNLVQATGTDTLGNTLFVRHGVLAGEFADPADAVDDAVMARVNEGGLDQILDLAADSLTASSLAPTIAAANPVYSDSYGIAGWNAVTVDADIDGLWFDRLSLFADPQTDRLYVDVWIPNLFVALSVYGELVLWDYEVDAYIWASRAEIGGYVTLDAVNGNLVADFSDATVDLVGFGYDTSLIPGDIESWLLIDAVTTLLEGVLADQVEQRVPALLEEQLSALDISFETELMERTLTVEGAFSHASIDNKGVAIGLDLDVDIPGNGTHAYAGYLSAPTGAPHVDQSSDLAVALSDDLLNLVLFEAWQSGILELSMSTEDGSMEPLMLAPLQATQGTITVDAKLPPVIVEHEGGLHAQVSELEIVIDTPGGELGEHLVVAVSAFIDLELAVSNGTLRLDLGTPELDIVVRDSDWGASNETVTVLLSQMLPVDMLTSLLGEIEFPLPSLAGISIDHATVDRDISGVHTGVEISLD